MYGQQRILGSTVPRNPIISTSIVVSGSNVDMVWSVKARRITADHTKQ